MPIVVADVMATVCIYVRLMLLPVIVADVITTLLHLRSNLTISIPYSDLI